MGGTALSERGAGTGALQSWACLWPTSFSYVDHRDVLEPPPSREDFSGLWKHRCLLVEDLAGLNFKGLLLSCREVCAPVTDGTMV